MPEKSSTSFNLRLCGSKSPCAILRQFRIMVALHSQCLPGRKPRKGRDSKAQGAVKRSPGLMKVGQQKPQRGEIPADRFSLRQESRPVGPSRFSSSVTQGSAGTAGCALGFRISPRWGFMLSVAGLPRSFRFFLLPRPNPLAAAGASVRMMGRSSRIILPELRIP